MFHASIFILIKFHAQTDINICSKQQLNVTRVLYCTINFYLRAKKYFLGRKSVAEGPELMP
jgi:hypothetical protein